MPLPLEKLDEESRMLLSCFPVRNPNVEWHHRGGLALLEYKKEFNRLERALHRLLGGPTIIRRPLDRHGTEIWEMCDGKRRAIEICDEMDRRHHEEIEPALFRVWGFVQALLERNLVYLSPKPLEGPASSPVQKEGAKELELKDAKELTLEDAKEPELEERNELKMGEPKKWGITEKGVRRGGRREGRG